MAKPYVNRPYFARGGPKPFRPPSIESNWPDTGQHGLDLTADCDIAPLVMIGLPGAKLSGLTAPSAVQLHETSVRDNTGRDPVSGDFYLNE